MLIKVKIRNVYGIEKVYPACATAELFCKLVMQKTLTWREIELIKQLGYNISVVSEQPLTL